MKSKKGFTLVELIAVIVILGILVGVGVPVYMRIRDSILQTQYENTVSRIETAAASYASDTNTQDVVYVNVQFLIENGYISADDEYAIYDPRDDSSLNCFMVHVVIENGNYTAVMDDTATTEDDGTCSMYVSVGDYQIYCTLNGYTSECSSSWYSDNVELTLYKGSELVTSSDIEWTSQLGTYEISNSITTSALYLMSTTYIATYKEKILDYDENGTEYVSGEKTYKVSQVIKIDKENPVINNITYENSIDTWVASNTMYISASDRDGSGIYGYALINPSNSCSTASFQSKNSFELSNTTYKICVMDNVGNIIESDEITINNIDTTAPEINLSYSPTSWTTEVTLSFDASDSESGVRGYAITTTNEQPTVYINANRTSEYTTWDGASATEVETKNATYYLWVTDEVGNVSSKSIEVSNIDRVTPVGSISATKKSAGDSVSSGTWSSEGLNFTITTDTCGISGCTIYYCMDTENSCTPTTVATSGSQITTYNNTTGTYYIRYYLVSGAGVSSTISSYTAKIDTVTPTVSISATKKSAGTTVSSNTWSSEGLNFTLTKGTTGESGYTIYYCVDTANSCTPTTKATSGSSITSYNAKTGTYYVRYYIVSGAGKSSTVASYTAKVDTVTPTVSITATKKSAGTTVSSNTWSNEGLNFKLTAGTTGDSGYTIYYCVDTTNSCTPTTKATSGSSITSYNAKTGTYYVRYYIVSGAGLSSSVSSYTAKVDTVTPTVSITATKKSAATTVSSGSWSSEGLNFKLTAGTTGDSGYTIYYCVDTANSCTPTTKATSGSSITSYNAKTGTYYVRYYIVSGAGISSTTSSYTAKVDTVTPTVSITATKKSAATTVSSGTWSSEGLNFKLTAGTTGDSGYTIYYCMDTSNSCTPTTTISSGTSITSYNSTTGTYYIRYYIKSGAGISSTVSSYTAKVDTTAPTPSISASSTNSNYNTKTVNVTVSATDSQSGVAYVCVQTSSDSSKCTWYSGTSKTVQFTASSSYDGTSATYYAFAKDSVGNVSSYKSTTYIVYKECNNSSYKSSSTTSCTKTCGTGSQTTTVTDTLTGNTCSTTTSSCNTQSCNATYAHVIYRPIYDDGVTWYTSGTWSLSSGSMSYASKDYYFEHPYGNNGGWRIFYDFKKGDTITISATLYYWSYGDGGNSYGFALSGAQVDVESNFEWGSIDDMRSGKATLTVTSAGSYIDILIGKYSGYGYSKVVITGLSINGTSQTISSSYYNSTTYYCNGNVPNPSTGTLDTAYNYAGASTSGSFSEEHGYTVWNGNWDEAHEW